MKVLISSRSFGKNNDSAIEQLKNEGLTPVLNPYGRKLSEDELTDMVRDVVGIIAGTEEITQKVMDSAKSLRVISSIFSFLGIFFHLIHSDLKLLILITH